MDFITDEQIQTCSAKILIDLKPILQKRIDELLKEALGKYIAMAVREELEKQGYEISPVLIFCRDCHTEYKIRKHALEIQYCPLCGKQNVLLCENTEAIAATN